jgi:SAM-dependent methyltransferase
VEHTTSAFGVELGQPPYRLRLARYHALAETIGTFVGEQLRQQVRPIKLLDVGLGTGRSRRHIEVHPGTEHIQYHGVDQFLFDQSKVYKHQDWTLRKTNLEEGLPFVPSDHFDIVICEQVLEHLRNPELVLQELPRVLNPAGLLIVGVPIFPHGVHLIRRHVVPQWDRLTKCKKVRGHCQAFSNRTLLNILKRNQALHIQQVRGFRILSGGPLRPLEYFRWWWKINRAIGAAIPSWCIEVQVIATKLQASATRTRHQLHPPSEVVDQESKYARAA